MDRYLIALDLDGTLLNSKGEITPKTRQYLHDLDQQGHLIVIASGRPIRAIRTYYDELQLTSPIVCYNGAYVVSPYDARFQEFSFAFPQKIIKEIAKDVELYIENIMCETNSTIWLIQDDSILADFFWHDNMRIHFGSLELTLNEDPMTMIIKTFDSTSKDKLISAVGKHQGLAIRFWNGQYDKFSEIYYQHISKAAGLKYIADYFAIPHNRVIAFGDADNDLEMLDFAGIGVAMKNAIPLLKEKADMISIEDNDHDGIVKTLEQIIKTAE